MKAGDNLKGLPIATIVEELDTSRVCLTIKIRTLNLWLHNVS